MKLVQLIYVNKSILPPVYYLRLAVGSVMMETDIGTSFIIIMSAISVIAASGIKVKTFTKLSGILLLFMLLIATIFYYDRETIMTDSRKGRILAFLNPFDYIKDQAIKLRMDILRLELAA